jgi:hypothetical protein
VEEEIMFSPEMTPWVGIYIDRRDALDQDQSLSAGRRVRYKLWFTLWIWCFSFDRAEAVQRRDDAVAEVEVALMGNRTINDKTGPLWITGGRLPSARVRSETNALGQQSFIAGPFLVYFGFIEIPGGVPNGTMVTVLPSSTLIYANVNQLGVTAIPANSVVATNITGNTFLIKFLNFSILVFFFVFIFI